MSKFFADGIHPKTIAALERRDHEVRPLSFRGRLGSEELSILNEIYAQDGIFLTSDRRLAKRLDEIYALRPGILVCPAPPTDAAVAHDEIAEIIHGIVSARERLRGSTHGLFIEPQVKASISDENKRLGPSRYRKRNKRRP
jgi:hypothetical protein